MAYSFGKHQTRSVLSINGPPALPMAQLDRSACCVLENCKISKTKYSGSVQKSGCKMMLMKYKDHAYPIRGVLTRLD